MIRNIGRCPRCGEFIIEEQARTHKCRIRTKRAKEIVFDWISDGFVSDNGDYVRLGKSLDGTLYSLVVCKHNPPHLPEPSCLCKPSDESFHDDDPTKRYQNSTAKCI